jgi:excisionase family DNA binding protein
VPSLPLAEAAAHLGVSVDTLRRRIRRGELEAAKDERGRYVVEVADTPAPSLDTPAGDLAEVAVLRERVARLEAELEARRREAEAAEVAQCEMRALVSQAQSLQLRLMGGGSSDSLDAGDGTMTPGPAPRRRWWQRGGEQR